MREILVGDYRVKLCENTESKYGYDVWYYDEDTWKPCWITKRGKDDYVVFYLGSSYEAKAKGAHKYYLHRLVYSAYMGFSQMRNGRKEVIHHIDGDKSNNDIENLVMMTREDHTLYHNLDNAWEGEMQDGDSIIDTRLMSLNILCRYVAVRDDILNIFKEIK